VHGTVENVADVENGCEVTISVSVGSDQAGVTSRGSGVVLISPKGTEGECDGL
jgi:hypothetical protein